MRNALRTYLVAAVAVLPLAALLLPLISHAEKTPPMFSKPNRVACYCGCEPKNGRQQCAKMCDLPKYQNRAWATSCHKPAPAAPRKSRESKPHPTRRNREEFSRR
jgi:hypothetical protein